MNEPAERIPASAEESAIAMWIAAYAWDVVRQIIRDGHPEPEDFISLCHSLSELQGKIIGGVDFAERAGELEMIAINP